MEWLFSHPIRGFSRSYTFSNDREYELAAFKKVAWQRWGKSAEHSPWTMAPAILAAVFYPNEAKFLAATVQLYTHKAGGDWAPQSQESESQRTRSQTERSHRKEFHPPQGAISPRDRQISEQEMQCSVVRDSAVQCSAVQCSAV